MGKLPKRGMSLWIARSDESTIQLPADEDILMESIFIEFVENCELLLLNSIIICVMFLQAPWLQKIFTPS